MKAEDEGRMVCKGPKLQHTQSRIHPHTQKAYQKNQLLKMYFYYP